MNNIKYQENLIRAMDMLAKESNTIFIGQTIVYGGSPMFNSTKNVPKEKKIEMPIFEDTQMGISIGLSLEGFIPISIFPRIDFLIIAANQLVNHLDRVEEMSCGRFKPKVIIRALVGSTKPLYPGSQHCQDHTKALKCLLTNVDVVRLTSAVRIVPAYRRALKSERSSILIELMDLYQWVPPYQK